MDWISILKFPTSLAQFRYFRIPSIRLHPPFPSNRTVLSLPIDGYSRQDGAANLSSASAKLGQLVQLLGQAGSAYQYPAS
jgi:hypothetical protein